MMTLNELECMTGSLGSQKGLLEGQVTEGGVGLQSSTAGRLSNTRL